MAETDTIHPISRHCGINKIVKVKELHNVFFNVCKCTVCCMLHNKWLLLQERPILSPSSIFTRQSSYQKETSSGPQQPSTAVSTLLGCLQLLSWSLAGFNPSLATDKQQTSWPRQAFRDAQTNRQTDSFTDTHSLQEIDSLMCGYSRSGMKTASE